MNTCEFQPTCGNDDGTTVLDLRAMRDVVDYAKSRIVGIVVSPENEAGKTWVEWPAASEAKDFTAYNGKVLVFFTINHLRSALVSYEHTPDEKLRISRDGSVLTWKQPVGR